jgi:hypothetical protein
MATYERQTILPPRPSLPIALRALLVALWFRAVLSLHRLVRRVVDAIGWILWAPAARQSAIERRLATPFGSLGALASQRSACAPEPCPCSEPDPDREAPTVRPGRHATCG